MKFKGSFYIILVFFLFSCKSEVEYTIEGFWTIDKIIYKGYEIRGCLNTNVINFELDESSNFPIANNCNDELKTATTNIIENWEILRSSNQTDIIPLRIKLTTKDEIFNGTHKVVFHRDPNEKLLKMEIWSDSIYFLCRKGWYNYDSNLSTIKKLESLSWTTRPQ